LRADAAALERSLIRYVLETGAESAAVAAHTAAAPAAHRFDIHLMREPRSACLKHRVASAGLLRLHQLHSSVATEHAIGL
jgi:hypothetical protein